MCITGAGGFIASHLARRLKTEGHYIVACDWKRNEYFSASCECDLDVLRLGPSMSTTRMHTHEAGLSSWPAARHHQDMVHTKVKLAH